MPLKSPEEEKPRGRQKSAAKKPTESSKGTGGEAGDTREDRLAKALRENLRRRKAAAKKDE